MTTWTDTIPAIDTHYARDVSFPIQFSSECDMLLDEDQEVVEQSLLLITFIPVGALRLFTVMGSSVTLAVFDQLDNAAVLTIDTTLRSAFDILEPRIQVDKQMIVDESPDNHFIVVIVPYAIKVNGQTDATRLTIPRPTPVG